ncbi:hypothetical protein [Dyella sp. 20L07]
MLETMAEICDEVTGQNGGWDQKHRMQPDHFIVTQKPPALGLQETLE